MNEQLHKTSGTDVLSSKKKTQKNPIGGEGGGFPLKVKSFQNTATYQKLLEGVPVTPSPTPTPPCTTGGVWICVYARGLNTLVSGIAVPVPKTQHVAFMYLTELKEF